MAASRGPDREGRRGTDGDPLPDSAARPKYNRYLNTLLPSISLTPRPTPGLVPPSTLSPHLAHRCQGAGGTSPSLGLPFGSQFHIQFYIPTSSPPLSSLLVSLPNPTLARVPVFKQKLPLPASHPGETTGHLFSPHQTPATLVTSLRGLGHPLPRASFSHETLDSRLLARAVIAAPSALARTCPSTRRPALLPKPTALTPGRARGSRSWPLRQCFPPTRGSSQPAAPPAQAPPTPAPPTTLAGPAPPAHAPVPTHSGAG